MLHMINNKKKKERKKKVWWKWMINNFIIFDMQQSFKLADALLFHETITQLHKFVCFHLKSCIMDKSGFFLNYFMTRKLQCMVSQYYATRVILKCNKDLEK